MTRTNSGVEEGLSSTPSAQSSYEAELSRLRQGLYRLFAASLLYPDRDRIATLRAVAGELLESKSLWGGFDFSDPLARLLKVLSDLTEEAKDEIEEDYVRLFLVKPIAPPYESFYLDPDGQSRGWMAVQIEREYADAGLILSPDRKKLPDQVAVELEFMAFLCRHQAQALEDHATDDSMAFKERQRAFMAQHLGRWFPRFARQVREATTADSLYGTVMEAAYAFLRHDVRLLELPQHRAQERHT
ncbi:MAG: molecular chaperone [Anaerolineae bacterium]